MAPVMAGWRSSALSFFETTFRENALVLAVSSRRPDAG